MHERACSKWSDDDLKFLRANWGNLNLLELSDALKRTKNSIQLKANRIGLKLIWDWTDDDLRYLKENWNKSSTKQIADELQRTLVSVSQTARKSGLFRKGKRDYATRPWTDAECEIMRHEFSTANLQQLANKLGRTEYAIRQESRKLDLHRKATYACSKCSAVFDTSGPYGNHVHWQHGNKKFWTKEKIDSLLSIYPTTPNIVLAQRFGVTESAIGHIAHAYQIKKEPIWNTKNIQQLKDEYVLYPLSELSTRLGKPESAVDSKAAQLNLKKNNIVNWTCNECGKVLKTRANIPFHMKTHEVVPDPLTSKQKQILLGSMLGDGCITYNINSRTYAYRETHKVAHQDYLRWKATTFGSLVSSLVPEARYDKRWKKTRWYVRMTMCGKWLKLYRDQFYPNGKKIVPVGILKELSALGIAVWFCDDGTRQSETSGLRIYTDDFTPEDVEAVSEWFFNTFLIKTNVTRRSSHPTHPILEIPSASTKAFVQLVEPYMPACMRYKITFREKIATGGHRNDVSMKRLSDEVLHENRKRSMRKSYYKRNLEHLDIYGKENLIETTKKGYAREFRPD